MRYIRIENNSPVDYTIEQLFQDYPDAEIYKTSQMPNEQLLANYSVYPLITEPLPQLTEDETVKEGVPEFVLGEWHQTWTVRKLTQEEITEIVNNRLPSVTADAGSDVFFAAANVQTERYEICKKCPSFTVLKTCRECGCIMPLKIKIASVSCPLAKW
jgi:hypothetical protein